MLRMMLIEMNMSGTFLIYFISITCVRLCVCRRLAVTAQKSQMRWSWLALHSWVSLDSITAATGEEVGRGYADVCVWMDWALQELAGGLVLRWIAPLQTSWFLIQLLFTPLHPSSSSWRKIAPIQSNTALLYTHAPHRPSELYSQNLSPNIPTHISQNSMQEPIISGGKLVKQKKRFFWVLLFYWF